MQRVGKTLDKISVVIPCYRSAGMLPEVVSRTINVLNNKNYEIILVNDGSPDETFSVICELAHGNKCIIGINLAKNFGQQSAIMTGLHYATGNIIVCMDDDGQTPPEAIPQLVEGLDDDYDVVYARYAHKQHSGFRNFGSYINDIMACQLINKPRGIYLSSFFAIKRYMVNEVLRYNGAFVYLPGLILRSTNRVRNVDVEHHARLEGASGYSFKNLLKIWLNGFTAFSIKPLRLADIVGCAIAGIGFLYLIYTIVMYFHHPGTVEGWHSLMAVLLILGGSIMLMLGMIGEYLGRVYISLNSAPQYVVRDVVRNNEEN